MVFWWFPQCSYYKISPILNIISDKIYIHPAHSMMGQSIMAYFVYPNSDWLSILSLYCNSMHCQKAAVSRSVFIPCPLLPWMPSRYVRHTWICTACPWQAYAGNLHFICIDISRSGNPFPWALHRYAVNGTDDKFLPGYSKIPYMKITANVHRRQAASIQGCQMRLNYFHSWWRDHLWAQKDYSVITGQYDKRFKQNQNPANGEACAFQLPAGLCCIVSRWLQF